MGEKEYDRANTVGIIPFEGADPIPVEISNMNFWQLLDTPNSYTGYAGKGLKVKSTEDGLEFTDMSPDAHASRHQPGGADALPTATPGNITEGATASEGTSSSFARADHVHGTPSEWTPKAHGNEAHSPDFLAVNGSNKPTADINWNSKGVYEIGYLIGTKYGYGTPPLLELFHNILAYADKKWTVTVSPAPTSGSVADMFDFAKNNYARWDNTVTLPIEITIEWTDRINLIKAVGIQFFWGEYISGVKIEAYNDNTGAWTTLVDESNNTTNRVVWTGNLNNITKIRYTLSGAYNESVVSIANLFALSNHPNALPYGYYLDIEGNMPMRGNLDMNSNKITNLADPTSAQDAATKAYVDNKTGDPPYILFSLETRETIIEKVKSQVSTPNLDSALLFFNSEEGRLEIFMPRKGEFRDLNGRVIQQVEPIKETFPAKVKYVFDEDFGIVRRMFIPVMRYRIKEGYTLDEDVGKIIKDGREVDPKEAIEQVIEEELGLMEETTEGTATR